MSSIKNMTFIKVYYLSLNFVFLFLLIEIACAAGGVLGLWSKCFLTTLYGTIILSIFAACKKDSKESGWEFLPLLKEPITQMKSTPFFRTEASKMKIHERGWTT